MLALPRGTRGDRNPGAAGCKASRNRGADASAGAGHNHHSVHGPQPSTPRRAATLWLPERNFQPARRVASIERHTYMERTSNRTLWIGLGLLALLALFALPVWGGGMLIDRGFAGP